MSSQMILRAKTFDPDARMQGSPVQELTSSGVGGESEGLECFQEAECAPLLSEQNSLLDLIER
ncbi:hypothetical protein M3P36_10095 [Altererythrobacter sp. KTW20L]|uniref:hypothetical protein n=1 Tax=Altererythrobacter sp. KTW20L TaxID=2942210 RepID=UPI0020BFF791|nr:hypothetical protein [Altererythrobacter sp. KTW20L]MCL6251388.1 hypothetical protein [Altererythrobacter sp. KTW20L]